MMLGMPGDATYANYQEANRAFYRLTVLPLVGKIVAAINGWLPDRYGHGVGVHLDLDNIPALAVEREAQWRRISEASSGVIPWPVLFSLEIVTR